MFIVCLLLFWFVSSHSAVVHNPNNKLSELQILRMGKDVAMGMNWLHLSKPPIIHRDLKPNNLLVSRTQYYRRSLEG